MESMGKVWPLMLKGIKWAILSGKQTKFWFDLWAGEKPLIEESIINDHDLNKTLVYYVNISGNWD